MAVVLRKLAAIALGHIYSATSALAAEPNDKAGVEFFEKKVRPVLVEKCYTCHAPGAKKIGGSLLLDTRDGIRKGGESGAAVAPGKPGDSILLEAIRYEGLEMPPKEKLPESVIADFEKWIAMGAPDPRDGKSAPPSKKIDFNEARQFWSFQTPKHTPPAAVKDAAWPKTEIDRYVLATHEAKGLHPAADADRRTLIRRASFDLVGLPPTPAEVEAFVNDSSPQAFEKVIDRLLASPQFGERWGRHWLDVARYGESTGKERNVPYHQAWRYRDYVIDSFNGDKPYDRFIAEQIAGDLLPAATPQQRNEQLVATGFLAIGPKGLNEKKQDQYVMDIVDEQLDVTTRAVLGTTVACARCHDHKFDPIPTTDYYALAGIFKSTNTYAGVKRGARVASPGDLMAMASTSENKPEVAKPAAVELSADAKRRQQQVAALEQEIDELQTKGRELAQAAKQNDAKKANKKKAPEAGDAKGDLKTVQQIKQKVKQLQNRIAKLGEAPKDSSETGAELAMAVADAARPGDCQINIRGEPDDLGPEVPRGFVTVLADASAPKIDPKGSGRLELSQWLASKNNPLTARVMVNRIWGHLFGVGLVESVDNFGNLGERPSHPELLDYLALEFMKQDWSVKQAIKSVMLSRTYQMSSDHDAANYAIDPSNKLVWRMSRRRLDAEAIRDAALAVSGQLDLTRPTASGVARLGDGEIGRGLDLSPLKEQTNARSVYLPIVRGAVPEVLSVFDVADPNLVVGQREVTTVATQALYMMNSPFVAEQASKTADRLLNEGALAESKRIDKAYELILARPATDSERNRAIEYLAEFNRGAGDKVSSEDRRTAWTTLCQTLLASGEFRYVY